MITINNTEELFEDNYDIESQYMDYKIIKSYDVYLYPNNIITPRIKLKLGIGYLLENNSIIVEQFGFNIQPIYFMTIQDLYNYFQEDGLIGLEINHVHSYLEMYQKFNNENNKEVYLN
jgi:hypothetical protein